MEAMLGNQEPSISIKEQQKDGKRSKSSENVKNRQAETYITSVDIQENDIDNDNDEFQVKKKKLTQRADYAEVQNRLEQLRRERQNHSSLIVHTPPLNELKPQY